LHWCPALNCRVGQNHIYGVYTVFLAGKSPYIRSYTGYIYGFGLPYLIATYWTSTALPKHSFSDPHQHTPTYAHIHTHTALTGLTWLTYPGKCLFLFQEQLRPCMKHECSSLCLNCSSLSERQSQAVMMRSCTLSNMRYIFPNPVTSC